jgi:hypothetical protein
MGDGFFDSNGAFFDSDAVVAVAVAGKSSSVVRDDDFFSGGCDDAIFAAMVLLLLGRQRNLQTTTDRAMQTVSVGRESTLGCFSLCRPSTTSSIGSVRTRKAESRFRWSGRSAASLSNNKTTKHYSPNSGGGSVHDSTHSCVIPNTAVQAFNMVMERNSIFSLTLVEFCSQDILYILNSCHGGNPLR